LAASPRLGCEREPGESLGRLERQILEQDPELGAWSRRTRPALVPPSAWRHPVRVAVAGAVVLAVAVGLAGWRLVGSDAEQGTAGAIALDPDTGAVRETISFGTSPSKPGLRPKVDRVVLARSALLRRTR
jgi:hypothetical protein